MKTKDAKPIEIRAARNGLIVVPLVLRHECAPDSNNHVFNSIDDMFDYLRVYFDAEVES